MDEQLNFPLPEAFLQRVRGQLGGEFSDFLAAMEEPAVRGLRMNPFRKPEENPFREAKDPIPWVREGYEIPLESQAGVTAAHEAGAFYLQDPAAMLPAAVMNARPGERILDLCAAPGGKSTQMGLDMAGEGLLICNEPVARRAAVLSRNMERMGIPHAAVLCAWPEQLSERWEGCFDGVLADVPCSGEGMFRRHPETRKEWTEEQAAGCVRRQKEILEHAARMICPGGRLVYSTCTWNPAENEEQIQAFLKRHPEFAPEPFHLTGIGNTAGMYTCWPHRIRGEGQFVALLRREGSGSHRGMDTAERIIPGQDRIRTWRDSGIKTPEPNALFGQTMIRMNEVPDLRGLHVLRLGLHLGQCRGKLFLPDHAAALGPERPDMPETKLTDDGALRYLAGETVEADTGGWTLMTWRGLVLGWGKGSGGVIRNHYPRGLRNGKLIC